MHFILSMDVCVCVCETKIVEYTKKEGLRIKYPPVHTRLKIVHSLNVRWMSPTRWNVLKLCTKKVQ